MSHTTDNDKKAKDNNAFNHEKNMEETKNKQEGRKSFSKKTDHLWLNKNLKMTKVKS